MSSLESHSFKDERSDDAYIYNLSLERICQKMCAGKGKKQDLINN